MDNNFYKILESFKRVNEGQVKQMLWDLSDRMSREQFIDYTTSEMGYDADEMAEFWDGIHGELDEEFTGYWKGTDKRTPGRHMVGASESVETECGAPMSLADKLKARWEETKREKGLQEYGMTTGGTQNPTAQATPADLAKQTADVQQDVNKLKSAGVNIPSGSQAVQSLMKDPVKDPASQLDKTIDAGLGQEIQKIVTKGQPNDVNQLAALIKKVNQQSGT
jgi:hypothetical protein